MRRTWLLSITLVSILLFAGQAFGHSEREANFPPGDGEVPEYRTTGPRLVVCKDESFAIVNAYPEPLKSYNLDLWAECRSNGYAHIQAAIDAVTDPGTRVMVMPGVYHEEPSLAPQTGECADLENQDILSYAEQYACPHVQNLIAIMGDSPDDEDDRCTWERLCRLQIEGTGAVADDVMIDVAWTKLNGIRADRADGVYIKNLLVQRTDFNSIYVLETDGAVIDGTVTRWNYEYGILTFAVDHTLYKDCVAYGNGDAGLYPGSASDLGGRRFSVEITGCDSYHNMAGYSGTAGNSVYVHDNDFHHNAAGATMDSLFPGHPGLPQDSAVFVDNRFYSNNMNFYENLVGPDAPCHRPIEERGIEEGVVCPVAPVPIGSGIVVAGGNHNVFADNWFWDNWRYAYVLFAVPAPLREETDPLKALDTSHYNRFTGNHIGITPDGEHIPNGAVTWWDEGGAGNCWEDNEVKGNDISHPPSFLLPSCSQTPVQTLPSAAKLGTIAPCALYDKKDEVMHHPPGCWWLNEPSPPSDPNLLWFEPWQPPTDFPTAKSGHERAYEAQIRSGALDANEWFRMMAGQSDLVMDRHALDSDHLHHGPNMDAGELPQLILGRRPVE